MHVVAAAFNGLGAAAFMHQRLRAGVMQKSISSLDACVCVYVLYDEHR
jgi:hypothetical protein